MGKAARAIIIENDRILLMHRRKYGSEYYTLVGGRVNEGETVEQALAREIMEETSLSIARARLVYYEAHPAPYNEQYIFLCDAAPHQEVKIQEDSEENIMNNYGVNMHNPVWVGLDSFEMLQFRSPQLHFAITKALKKGFPAEPVRL